MATNSDALRSAATMSFAQGQLRDTGLIVPPELQFFVQRLSARAAGMSGAGATTAMNAGRDGTGSGAPGSMTGIRIAMFAIALLALGTLISRLLAG